MSSPDTISGYSMCRDANCPFFEMTLNKMLGKLLSSRKLNDGCVRSEREGLSARLKMVDAVLCIRNQGEQTSGVDATTSSVL